MYRNFKIGVVIPAYNEEAQILKVTSSIPSYIDHIIVVNDGSKDNTLGKLQEAQLTEPRLKFFSHEKNRGTGAARITGLKNILNEDVDIVALIDGDGQMDLSELPSLLDSLIDRKYDLAKGNRFFSGEAWSKIPKVRYLGNAMLSLLTKISSGYWHIADFQTGYIVIRKSLLAKIDLDHLYHHYGFPNDLLIHANIAKGRVVDVPIKPIYGVGEKSNIKFRKVIPKIGWLLIRRFFWRLKEKYVIRDFHPLVLFYFIGFMFAIITLVLFIRLFYMWGTHGKIPSINALAAMFSFMSSNLFILFAMWFDMEYNKDLK